ncbi:MAG: ABC transporter permease [Gammaproteobacteria bacterium]|nr:ABC transporter permease [Gammaproteobacteria bacterium]MCP5426208.1 ABC transporter permease [Gammaproteobacteria bacterium]
MTEKADTPRAKPASNARAATLLRLRGLIRKEFLQIRRDPSSIAIAFIMPVFLLLLFGYGVSLDAKDVPIALVVEQPSAETASFIGAFRNAGYFQPHVMHDMRVAVSALRSRQVDGIVRLRAAFTRKLKQADGAPIQVIVNGVDANTARMVQGYVQGVWAGWLEKEAMAQGDTLNMPVKIEQRVWFNAELRSRNFLVPGLIAVIMTLIGALLTAMVMAREWERGTLEALLVTPVAIREILIGKLIPYFLLGMGGLLLSVAMAVWLFGVPLRGSLWVLLGAAALFLLAALGMGLLISIITRSQFVAGQIAIIVTFLPAFILSGFIFDIGSMPPVVQILTHLIPARYFVTILQTVFLAGNVWSVILPNSLALLLMAALFMTLARSKAHKHLE